MIDYRNYDFMGLIKSTLNVGSNDSEVQKEFVYVGGTERDYLYKMGLLHGNGVLTEENIRHLNHHSHTISITQLIDELKNGHGCSELSFTLGDIINMDHRVEKD